MTITWTAVLIVSAACVGYILLVVAVLRRFDGSREAPRRGFRTRSRAGETRTWARRAIARRLHRTTITPGGDPPAPSPPSLYDGFRAALAANKRAEDKDAAREAEQPAPSPEPTRKATRDEMRDAEVQTTRPWSDDTGSFTAFVEAGETA